MIDINKEATNNLHYWHTDQNIYLPEYQTKEKFDLNSKSNNLLDLQNDDSNSFDTGLDGVSLELIQSIAKIGKETPYISSESTSKILDVKEVKKDKNFKISVFFKICFLLINNLKEKTYNLFLQFYRNSKKNEKR
jgi:uncharacterized protein YsxB (DUF464 family)